MQLKGDLQVWGFDTESANDVQSYKPLNLKKYSQFKYAYGECYSQSYLNQVRCQACSVYYL